MPPMNAIGTRKPKSARLGMVCAILAAPMIQRRAETCRASQMPAGMANAVAAATAIPTISRCSSVRVTTSGTVLLQAGEKGLCFGRFRLPEFRGREDQVQHALLQEGDAAAHPNR